MSLLVNGLLSLDPLEPNMKELAHLAANSLEDVLASRVLFHSTVSSRDPQRALFALKKFLDLGMTNNARLMAELACKSNKRKRWHDAWIAEAKSMPFEEIHPGALQKFVTIGKIDFSHEFVMRSGIETWNVLPNHARMEDTLLALFQYINTVDCDTSSPITVFVEDGFSDVDLRVFNAVGLASGFRVIVRSCSDMASCSSESNYIALENYLNFKDTSRPVLRRSLEEAVWENLTQYFCSLLDSRIDFDFALDSSFSSIPLRPLQEGPSKDTLVSLKNCVFNSETGFKRALKAAKYFSNIGAHKLVINIITQVPRDKWSKFTHKWLIDSLFELGKFEDVVRESKLVRKLSKLSSHQLSESKAALELISEVRKQKILSEVTPTTGTEKSLVSVLHACPPFQSGGYVNRAHGIIKSLNDLGWTVSGLTRPGFPDRDGVTATPDRVFAYDGIKYIIGSSSIRRKHGEFQYMIASVDYYESYFARVRPDIIHLRSTYVSALPALIAARRLGIPTVYEVSGMWELVYAAKQSRDFIGRFCRTVIFEDLVYRFSDRVVTSTAMMKSIIESRRTNEDEVVLVPNAVDPIKFTEQSKNLTISASFGWEATDIVIGYLGSFVDYEGLDLLVRAVDIVRRKFANVRLLLVGDGAVLPALRKLIVELELTSVVRLTGRVPHDSIPELYSIVDITPFPRLDTPATRAVAPLKPFEAISSGKRIVVSDISALKEIVKDSNCGEVFEAGSVEKLATALIRSIESGKCDSKNQRDWIKNNRSWDVVGKAMDAVLSSL